MEIRDIIIAIILIIIFFCLVSSFFNVWTENGHSEVTPKSSSSSKEWKVCLGAHRKPDEVSHIKTSTGQLIYPSSRRTRTGNYKWNKSENGDYLVNDYTIKAKNIEMNDNHSTLFSAKVTNEETFDQLLEEISVVDIKIENMHTFSKNGIRKLKRSNVINSNLYQIMFNL